MNNKQREEMIVNAINWAKNTQDITLVNIMGIEIYEDIVAESYVDAPMCLLMHKGKDLNAIMSDDNEYKLIDAMTECLKTDVAWIYSFTSGWDAEIYEEAEENLDDNTDEDGIYFDAAAFKMGRKLGIQFRPEPLEWAINA